MESGSMAPPEDQPGVEQPKSESEGRKRGPHPDAGRYVVLAAKPEKVEPTDVGADEPAPPQPGGFVEVGIYEAASAREAKQKAIDGNKTLADAVRGDGAFLAAVPLMSWKPALVVAEQPPPILSGL